MKKYHSPFFVIENAISPKQCESIISWVPERIDSSVVVMQQITDFINQILASNSDAIEQHFKTTISKYSVASLERVHENKSIAVHSENSKYDAGKWVRYNARDLTCVIFLSDYQPTIPFDDAFEVYGGKLEFPQWGFGFNPQRGTMIVFPSDPHFLNLTTSIGHGTLCQIRSHITTSAPYFYDAKIFSGTYKDWFK